MQRWKSFPRFFLLAVLLIGLLAGISAPAFVSQNAKAAPVKQTATNVVISEFRFHGTLGGNDEFIELYNPTGFAVDISGWLIRGSNNAASISTRATIPAATTISPFQYYLITNNGTNGYSGLTPSDLTYGTGITDDGGIALTLANGTTIIDQVGLSNGSAYKEGAILPSLTTNTDQSYARKLGGVDGNCLDNGNNTTDFTLISPSDPQNSTSAAVACGVIPVPPIQIIINEIAWAGTKANEGHEWIELYNPGLVNVDMTGWTLQSSDSTPIVPLTGIISAGGYYLLERDFDTVVFDIPADQIYSGALANAGESLSLIDPLSNLVDTANLNGGAWPAGSATTFGTMERNGTMADSDAAWFTNVGVIKNGLDFNEDPLWGTPKNGNSPTPTPTSTPTSTNTSTPSVTPTITGTRPTPTRTGTATRTATPNPPLLTVIINEVAWMGTIASTSDEWIELYNPGSVAIDLTGWVLRADDESPFITWNSLDLTNVFIQPGQYYLLERTDDTTVTSFTANKIYSNALDDSPGDVLKLFDAQGRLIDTANSNGGDWPAGVSTTTFRRSMERTTPIIQDGNASWATFAGTDSGARDANNGIINGTPGFKNWVSNITLTPSRTPTATRRVTNTATPRPRTATPTPFDVLPVGRPFINEFLPRPGFDWNLDGKVDTFDEFIELKNVGNADMNLSGWRLDDSADFPGALSSAPYTITDLILKPGEYAIFYASQTNILLSDGGDSVRLFDASGNIMDVIDFTIAKVEDESVCRLPDGNGFGSWFNDCTPTPNLTNSRDGQVPTLPEDNSATPFCALPDTLPTDFLFAECRGYGANIWDNFYWDEFGWMGDQIVPENKNKWKSFIE